MDEERFWRLVEEAKVEGGGECAQQSAALTERLVQLGPDEIIHVPRGIVVLIGDENPRMIRSALVELDEVVWVEGHQHCAGGAGVGEVLFVVCPSQGHVRRHGHAMTG